MRNGGANTTRLMHCDKMKRIRPTMTTILLLSALIKVQADLFEYGLSNDVDSYPIPFSSFKMTLETAETEPSTSTLETIRVLSEREIDSMMLMEYGMNYSSASYTYMDGLIFDEINFNGSAVVIGVSEGYTYFNVPYGAKKPEKVDWVVEDAVNNQELVQLLGQTGLDELSKVRSIRYSAGDESLQVPVESERAPDSGLITNEPIAKPNYIPVIISMAVLTSLLSFFTFLFIYRRRKNDKTKSPPTTPSTINGPDASFNSDFVLSKSTSDIESSSKPTKAFPIMLRKDMLSPTDTDPKIPFMEKPRRREEEGNTVLASSHFTAPHDAISAVSSIDFEIDSTVWDPNDTMDDNSQDPFVDPIPSNSLVLDNNIKITRCRDDSVVL